MSYKEACKKCFPYMYEKLKNYCSQIKHSNDKMRTTKMAMLLMSSMIRSQIIDKNYKQNVHSQMHKQSVSWTLFSLFFYVKEGEKGLIYSRQPWISGLRTIYETLFPFLTCLCFKKLSYADLYLKPWYFCVRVWLRLLLSNNFHFLEHSAQCSGGFGGIR